MSIFNPSDWKKEEIKNIDDETMNELDQRYINAGENIYDQNIQNLNVVNLNIGNSGRLYFNDNTSQTTAYIPSFVTNQINNFLSNNNKFIGQNIFTNLNIEDGSSGIGMKIYQSGNNINIENMKTNGSILLKNNGITTSISSAGKLTTREISGDIVNTSLIIMENNFNIYSDNGNTIFDSLGNGKEFVFKTMQSNGINRGWSLVFNPQGVLYGMNNIITHSIESKSLKFRDNNTFALTNSQIFLSSTYDMVFDNNVSTRKTNMRFTNYNTSGIGKTIIFDENANISGVNDITMTGKITMNNITHQFLTNQYIIDNNNNNSSIVIRNRDNLGVLREINISPTMNMTGLNDLYCQRLFINNVLVNFASYNDTVTKTQLLTHSDSIEKRLLISTSQGAINLVPNSSVNSNFNSIVKQNDSVIFFTNNTSPSISIVPLSSGNTAGLRIATETEIYKPKIMDTLKFSDNSIQTTAMTESYLTSFVNNLISQSVGNPTGTILSYVGTNIPSGYLLCDGSLISQITYANLFLAIGHKFLNGRTLVGINNFYLPDLRGAIMKGVSSNPFFNPQNAINNVGEIQQSNVGYHKHQYSDYRNNQKSDSSILGNNVVRQNNISTEYTSGETYNYLTNTPSLTDNLVNSVGVNYIIKI